MKKLTITVLLAFAAICCVAQKNPKNTTKPTAAAHQADVSRTFSSANSKSVETFYSISGPVSHVTAKKDTLYLKNDEVGKLIAETWVTDPKPEIYGKKPVIIFVEKIPVAHATMLKPSTFKN